MEASFNNNNPDEFAEDAAVLLAKDVCGRCPRATEVMAALEHAAPFLVETLTFHWSTGQGTRVRHILWSLYTCSHGVNLGDACSGLDRRLAEALAAAVAARLILGPEVEPYRHDAATKKIELDPVEAPIAKRVFTLAKELRSPAKVADMLNGEGLRTSQRFIHSRRGGEKLVGGKRFIPDKITRIVTNPIYKEIIRHNGQDHAAEHPSLVTATLWQEANDALNGRMKMRHCGLNRNEHQTMLKGLIRCGVCGHRLTPKAVGKKDKDGNPYVYYTCNEVSKDGKAAACSLRSVPVRANG